MVNSALHHETYPHIIEDLINLWMPMSTYEARLVWFWVLDTKPAWPHDLPLEDEQFEWACCGAEYVCDVG